jgi:nicotinate-nucleotide--dimethylbenzimidazole phosphoribosyltransferase
MLNTPSQLPETLNGLPFQDIKSLVFKMPFINNIQGDIAKKHQQKLFQPVAADNRLGQLAIWLAGWQGRTPSIRRPELCLFAGASEIGDPDALEQAQTAAKFQLVMLSSGGSAANSLATSVSAGLRVFDLAIDQPGRLITETAAMTELGCARAFAFGMEALAANADLLCLAGFGPGSQMTAAATALCLLGGPACDWVRQADAENPLDPQRQIAVLEAAYALHKNHADDPLELLRRTGSREIAALCGAIVAARMQSVPVILDGFVATVAAALLARLNPGSIDHCLLGMSDGSPTQEKIYNCFSLEPMLHFGLRTSDGAGALMALQNVKAAIDLYTETPQSGHIV